MNAAAIFDVQIESLAEDTILRLRGELDSWTQGHLVTALSGVDERASRIVLDLSELTFMCGSSTALIHRWRTHAAARGTDLVLRSPGPPVQRLLDLTGLCAGAVIN